MNNLEHTIWIVEDETTIAEPLIYALETEGYHVKWFQKGHDMLAQLQTSQPNLLVLDIGLPDINGFELCRMVLKKHELPLLFLTARSDEIDRIVGLEMGADDYIAKPFSPREVCVRIRGILRRYQKGQHSAEQSTDVPRSVVEHFEVFEDMGIIRFCGTDLSLTRYEFLLLLTLIRSPKRIFVREQLMDKVWSNAIDSMDRTIDTHIKTLRQKLKQVNPDLQVIITHRGMGYSLNFTSGLL